MFCVEKISKNKNYFGTNNSTILYNCNKNILNGNIKKNKSEMESQAWNHSFFASSAPTVRKVHALNNYPHVPSEGKMK